VSTLALAAAVVVPAAILAPHLAPLHKAAAPVGIAVWLLVLALRAFATVVVATLVLAALTDFSLVHVVLDWCWHGLLPDVPGALGFDEHPASHAAVAGPAILIAGSLAWLAVRAARGAIAVRRVLDRALGAGPFGSTVIRDERVVFGVTGFGRGRVLVSDRALDSLDDGELAAGLMHEQAHLRRLHRPVLAMAAFVGAVGGLLPGTRAAARELRFHLERDADEYTVRTLHDPLALASAICKAAAGAPAGSVASLGGRGGVALRLEQLLDGSPPRSGPAEHSARALLVVLACVVGLIASAPAWAFAAPEQASIHGAEQCHHDG
jgi:Zn-dependent protease with chaperone function